MRLLLLIVVPPILLFICALAMLAVPLPDFFPLPWSRGRNQLSAILVGGVGGLGYLVSLTFYLVWTVTAPARSVDRVFIGLGMSSERYMLFGRHYQDWLDGRRVDIYFQPGYRLRPAVLNIYVEADLGTRLAMGSGKPLLDCRGCPRLAVGDPNLSHLHVLAQDQAWAYSLLADATVNSALNRLLAPEKSAGLGEVYLYLQPDRIWVRSHPRQITESSAQQWLADLLAVVEVAEKLPRP